MAVLDELDRRGQAAALPLDARAGLRRLREAGLLLAHRDGRLSFRHALVREAVSRSVPAGERAAIHLAAYRHYAASDLADAERLPRLARHAGLCGLAGPAAGAQLELARRAAARHAYVEAELRYGEALAHLSDDDRRRVDGLRGRGLMRHRLGRYADSVADLDQARTLAAGRGDAAAEIELLLDEATALDWCQEFRRSQELVERAVELAGPAPPAAVEARLLMGLGRSAHRFNREEEAVDRLQRAARLAEPAGEQGYETLVVSLLLAAPLCATLGRVDEARRTFERVLAVCERAGDRLHLFAALGNRLERFWVLGDDSAGPRADGARMLAVAAELGNALLEQYAHTSLATSLHLLGDLDGALAHARSAGVLEQRNVGDAGRPEARLILARVLAMRGDEAEARACAAALHAHQDRAAAQGRREAQFVPAEALLLAGVDLATGEPGEAAWDELVRRSAAVSVGHDAIELHELRARWALRRGRPAAAAAALHEALAATARVPSGAARRLAATLASLTA